MDAFVSVKNYMIFFIGTAILLLGSCNGFGDGEFGDPDNKTASSRKSSFNKANADTRSVQGMMIARNELIADIKGMRLSGNADYDFALLMRSHHNSGVDMANAYMREAKDEQVKAIAKKMINAQRMAISKFDEFINGSQQEIKGMDTIFGAEAVGMMESSMTMSGLPAEIDAHFITIMIPHHRSAIEICNQYLVMAKGPHVKAMAQQIVTTQKATIEGMQTWQHENDPK